MILAQRGQSDSQKSTANPDSVAIDIENRGEKWNSEKSMVPSSGETGRVNPIVNSNDEEEEEEEEEEEDDDSTESSSTSASDAEDEDTPVDELRDRGWLAEVNQPQNQLQHEMNGLALPSTEPPNFGDVSVKNATNVHFGNRTFYKGPVTIKQFVYANSTSVNEDKISSFSSNENGEVDKVVNNEDGNNGYPEGPKLSTSSSHPLYPFPHGRVADWLWAKRCILAVCVTALLLILLTILIVVLTKSSGTHDPWRPPYVPVSPNDSSINNDPTIEGVRFVKRVEWGAQPPSKPPVKLTEMPPPYIIISHTATTFCYTQAQCTLNVRFAQTFHIESRGWDDIGYNFLVGGDGNVYEGRGWDIEGSHAFNYNRRSIGISFIGTFNDVEPTKAQLHAAQKLIEFALENGKVKEDFKLLGHRQVVKTESPGEALYNIIRTWPHWSPTP